MGLCRDDNMTAVSLTLLEMAVAGESQTYLAVRSLKKALVSFLHLEIWGLRATFTKQINKAFILTVDQTNIAQSIYLPRT